MGTVRIEKIFGSSMNLGGRGYRKKGSPTVHGEEITVMGQKDSKSKQQE